MNKYQFYKAWNDACESEIHVSADANICNDKFRLGECFRARGQNVNSATKLSELPLRFLGPMRGIASGLKIHRVIV